MFAGNRGEANNLLSFLPVDQFMAIYPDTMIFGRKGLCHECLLLTEKIRRIKLKAKSGNITHTQVK